MDARALGEGDGARFRRLHVGGTVVHALVAVLVAALVGTVGPALAAVLVARLSLLARTTRRRPARGVVRPATWRRRTVELAFATAYLLAAGGTQLGLVALLSSLPLSATATPDARTPRDLGAVLLVATALGALPDLLAGTPGTGATLVMSVVLLLWTTGLAMAIATGERSATSRAERTEAARRRLLRDGLALDADERAAATDALLPRAARPIAEAQTLVDDDPADLVGARRRVTRAVAAIRAVVTDLHPAARRSREVAERVRAVLERRGHEDVHAAVLTPPLPEADVEVLLAALRALAEALPVAAGPTRVAITADCPGLRVAVRAPADVAAVAAGWPGVAARLAEVGGEALVPRAGEDGGTIARLELPLGVAEPVDHLAGLDALLPRPTRVGLAAGRLAVAIGLWPFTLAADALFQQALIVLLVAFTAWSLVELALALARRGRFGGHQVDGRAAAVDVVIACAFVAFADGGRSPVAYTLLLFPLEHAWLYRPRTSARLAALLLVAAVGAMVGDALVDGRAVLDAPTAAVALVLVWTWAVSRVLVAHRVVARERLRAADEGRRAVLAQALADADAERRRLAFALHDGPLQTLLSLRQDLEEGIIDPDRRDRALFHARLLRARRELGAALRATATTTDAGLRERLEATLVDAVGRRRLTTSLTLGPGVAGHHDELVVALARELVTNVVRHADARRLDVLVATAGPELVVEVADDGRGVPPGRLDEAPAEGHVGFASCRARAAAAGGSIAADPRPEGGTRVRVLLPLPGAAREAQRARAQTA